MSYLPVLRTPTTSHSLRSDERFNRHVVVWIHQMKTNCVVQVGQLKHFKSAGLREQCHNTQRGRHEQIHWFSSHTCSDANNVTYLKLNWRTTQDRRIKVTLNVLQFSILNRHSTGITTVMQCDEPQYNHCDAVTAGGTTQVPLSRALVNKHRERETKPLSCVRNVSGGS